MPLGRAAAVRAAEKILLRRWRPENEEEVTRVFRALFGREPQADEDAREMIYAAAESGLDYDETLAVMRAMG
jgi:hypothetical protein